MGAVDTYMAADPEIVAARHYRLHPDHVVEVIYRFTRTTGDPAGPVLREPAYLKRWTCHTCIIPGTLGCPGVLDLARADAEDEHWEILRRRAKLERPGG